MTAARQDQAAPAAAAPLLARFRIRLEHLRVHLRPLYAAQGIPARAQR